MFGIGKSKDKQQLMLSAEEGQKGKCKRDSWNAQVSSWGNENTDWSDGVQICEYTINNWTVCFKGGISHMVC